MAKLYIDGNYKGWIQLGSEKHPYGEVSKAFEAAQKKIKLPDIYLKNGEYTENFEIPENMKIYGESRDGVVIKNNDPLSISTITLKNNAALANITIIGGHTGILAEGQANIENCSVREFEKTGIDAISNESEIIIKNSEIGNSKGKGLYAQRGRKIYFADNEVHNNKEEGLDLRQVVSGEISNNKIYDNEESGIESVACGSHLLISKNEIWGNKSNGITFQYYEDEIKEAQIIIEENKISVADPQHFTISVANPSGEKNKPENFWRKSIKIYDNNILEGEIKKRSLDITKK